MRKSHTPAEKAQCALEALRGKRTIAAIAAERGLHPNQVSKWKRDFVNRACLIFETDAETEIAEQKERDKTVQELQAQKDKLAAELEWVKGKLKSEFSVAERRSMVDMEARELSITAQTELLGINRTSLYYKPVPPSEKELLIKSLIEKIHAEHPEFGCRRITASLNKEEGLHVNHKAVYRHMREMGINARVTRNSGASQNH
ncbi:MAG: IS3 family transposase [Clostridiales bacterium]|jgi:putative transposase|nr:IS3 family transposase [Clostridiales bacterium]